MNPALLSSADMTWETPPSFFNKLHEEFNFTLDVCATGRTSKCARHFTPDMDGLKQSWVGERCWMNPPYGRAIAKWVQKAAQESQRGALVVGLLPARTDTHYWHKYVLEASEVRFVKGRIRFILNGVAGDAAPFPSAVVVWRPPTILATPEDF